MYVGNYFCNNPIYIKIFIYLAQFCFKSHDTIRRLNCVVPYLNKKMKQKSAEIIDLQLCSSLK